jgi:intracellular multiplication protein IcmX
MKIIKKGIIAGLVLLGSLPLCAENVVPPTQENGLGPMDDGYQKLVQYLHNLGAFLGYDLSQDTNATVSSSQLVDSAFTQVVQTYMINTLFGAFTVNTSDGNASSQNSYFLPGQNDQNSMYGALLTLNNFANSTFARPPYNVDGSINGAVSVVTKVDQQPYQNDPVSQSILNILATPNPTYCMNYDQTDLDLNSKTCPPLTQNLVMSNVVGADSLPSTYQYFSGDSIQNYLGQLNSDSLIAPLMYDTGTSQNPSSSQNQTSSLKATNNAQVAANFIRYVTNSVTPITLPARKVYDNLYIQATDDSGKFSNLQKGQARLTLTNYLTSLRSYTAQMSVAYSNLYYILSKRLPQTNTTGSDKPTSEAMNEFVMATWRLNNPNNQKDNNTTWLQKINGGSSATVQKEIAILLAEINYQLYLNRLQDERLLLTQSIALVKSNRATPPIADLSQGTPPTQ